MVGKVARSDKVFDIANVVIVTMVLFTVTYPLIYVMSASVSDPRLVNLGKIRLLPRGFNVEGYKRILEYSPVWIGYRNSVFYVVLGTSINLFVTLTCAYALSRKDFYGRNLFTALFVLTMFFSGGLIPRFLVVRSLGILDTVWAMVLPSAVAMWNIVVTRTYLQRVIPFELQEAAVMDGCSNTRLFVSVILPLSVPIIAVMALFYGVGHWNAYFNALIYLSDRKLYPLQLFLREILVLDQYADILEMDEDEMAQWLWLQEMRDSMKYGLVIVSSVPVMLAYPFLQKYFVKGIMLGSLKG